MNTGWRRWAGVAFVGALLLVGVSGVLSYRNTASLTEAARAVAHTHQVLTLIARVSAALYRAEAMERGYLLTSEEKYAGEYETAARDLFLHLEELQKTIGENPPQQARLLKLESLARKRIQDLNDILGIYRAKGPQAARAALVLSGGRNLMVEFWALIREAREEEESLLNRRVAQAQEETQRALYTVTGGNVLGFVLVALALGALRRDHAKRRQAEEALRQAHDVLDQRVRERTAELAQANADLRAEMDQRRRAEEQIREQAALLDKVGESILVLDPKGLIRFWNNGARRLYGWTQAEALGKSADLLQPAGLADPNPENAAWSGEVRQVTRDGREIIVESHQTPLFDSAGAAAGRLVVNLDVTEKKGLESQFRRAQRLESIGMLAGGIAHDLNNVLTPILMSAKLLRKDRPEAQRLSMLDTVQTSAERGAQMVQQLLAFAGGVEGERSLLHLKPVVKEIRHILDHTLPKTITIQVVIADDLWPVLGDATQLSQVLMNLCINARDAMPHGGTLTVTAGNELLDENFVRTHVEARPGPHVLLAVTDTGIGIAPEVLDRIFDPFFTTKPQGKGTGLGLASAMGIVKGHGGFITVYSEVGRGTRFALYLPAVESAETERARQESRTVQAGHGETILVVDDEPFIVLTARAALEEHGYRVHTASHGEEALELFRHHREEIRAVVLDMMMPGLDTPAILRGLHGINPDVPILASSGLRQTGANGEAVATYARGFLQKPYTDTQLLAALAGVLTIDK